MKSDTEIKLMGLKNLIETMGVVNAERFVNLLGKEPMDFHQYHHMLFKVLSLEEIHQMNHTQPE